MRQEISISAFISRYSYLDLINNLEDITFGLNPPIFHVSKSIGTDRIREQEGEVWPSMVTHTWNLCSAFNPSKCTHTHSSEHTPGAVGSQCCGARGAVGGSVPCSRVSPQSWYWRWREYWLFTPPPTIPAGPGTRTHNLQVTSPTLYPLGHDCPTNID